LVRLKPQDAQAHDNLGTALNAIGRRPEAKAEFVEALRLKPDYDAVREKLAKMQAEDAR